MIPYILYAAIILTACLIFYKLLLQKETFFRLNRFVLLVCMALAFVVPLLRVPQQMSFRKMPVQAVGVSADITVLQNTVVQSTEKNAPAFIEAVEKNSAINFQQVTQWAVYLYWFGVILFALNFLMQAGVLLYKAYSKPVIKDGRSAL